MNLLDFFRGDEDTRAQAVAEDRAKASTVIEWARSPYHDVFMSYLEAGADHAVLIGDHMVMLQAAVRANTFKEIRAHIRMEMARAAKVMEDTRGI